MNVSICPKCKQQRDANEYHSCPVRERESDLRSEAEKHFKSVSWEHFENVTFQAVYVNAFIKGAERSDGERRKLKREIEVLREYGNKDCTAMADEVLERERNVES